MTDAGREPLQGPTGTWRRAAMWAALLLASVVLAGVVAVALFTWRSLPQTNGTLRIAGAAAEIRIVRDADGIPTIRAASAADAFFGLGFVHAQDRLWQLETHRRIGAGRLAEAFGEGALDADRFLRALGVRRAARAQWALTTGDTRAAVLAYTAGINAFIGQAMTARPPEFAILGLQPEPWAPEDTLAWAIMMAWDLGGNWSTELLKMRLALQLPVARIDELLPPNPGDAAPKSPSAATARVTTAPGTTPLVATAPVTTDYAALFRALKVDGRLGQQALAAAPESGIEGVGSNNWVIAGSHTRSGAPLLANDPHLKLSAPALWYLARLEAPGLKVAGATLPGLPMVVLGQNEHVAWGFTNTGPDVQDLYLERIQPGDATRYQTPDGWAAFDSTAETIRVKGRPDVAITVRSTRHGPVISDAGGPTEGLTGGAAKPVYALAMRWTALDADAGAGSLAAGLAFNRAASVDAFIAASASYVAPMQNMVVADRAGRIAMVSAGRVPLRRPDNDLMGQVPSPGWDARYDWAGFLAPGLTPREVDPPRGWIGSANQRIHPPDYPHYLTNEWAAPYRMQRIAQLLEATPRHDVASLRAMQGDVLSQATLRLLPFARRAVSAHPLAAAAQRQLAGFDGTMAADRAAPLILWAFARQLTQGVFADELGAPLWERVAGGRSFRDALEGVLARDDAWWCDDKSTPAVAETCQFQLDAAFGRALDELRARHGADVAAWRWGAAHVARAEHRPFSKVRALAGLFELRTPVGGDTYTLNVSRVGLKPDATTGELYLDEHGPGLRAIYDLGDPANSRVVHSGGQSGHPFSQHYRDFLRRWARVDDVPLWGGATPEGDAGRTLLLAPRSP